MIGYVNPTGSAFQPTDAIWILVLNLFVVTAGTCFAMTPQSSKLDKTTAEARRNPGVILGIAGGAFAVQNPMVGSGSLQPSAISEAAKEVEMAVLPLIIKSEEADGVGFAAAQDDVDVGDDDNDIESAKELPLPSLEVENVFPKKPSQVSYTSPYSPVSCCAH